MDDKPIKKSVRKRSGVDTRGGGGGGGKEKKKEKQGGGQPKIYEEKGGSSETKAMKKWYEVFIN